MPHWVRGFLVSGECLCEIDERYVACPAVSLRCGIVLIPLIEELRKEIQVLFDRATHRPASHSLEIPDFVKLSPAEIHFANRMSREFPIAFIQTDYHGGTGFQFAITWLGGRVVQPPTCDERPAIEIDDSGPINQSLVHFCVRPLPKLDRFATVGLTWYRGMDEFENPESEYYDPTYLARCEKEWGF